MNKANVAHTNDGRLLRPADVAHLLGKSRSWSYKAARDGLIPGAVFLRGVGLRFDEPLLREWIAENSAPAESYPPVESKRTRSAPRPEHDGEAA